MDILKSKLFHSNGVERKKLNGIKKKINFDDVSTFNPNINSTIIDNEKNYKTETKLKEQQFARNLFIISFIILLGKLFYILKPLIWEQIYIKRLIRHNIINDLGIPKMRFTWENEIKISPIIWPIICGISVTIFTWGIIYLDSDEPGINPPMPFSPTKYKLYQYRKRRQMALFQMGYLLSICSGIAVFCLLYFFEF